MSAHHHHVVLSLISNKLIGAEGVPVQIRLDPLFDEDDKMEIGRSDACKVSIPSLHVSRSHAVIKRVKKKRKLMDPSAYSEDDQDGDEYSYCVVDNSTNGLRLNSVRMKRGVEVGIVPGDLIDIVPSFLRFKFETVLVETSSRVRRRPQPAQASAVEKEKEEEPVGMNRKRVSLTEEAKEMMADLGLEMEVMRVQGQNEMLKAELEMMREDQAQLQQQGGNQASQIISLLESQLTCALCNHVYVDPIMLSGCDHTFCSQCIVQTSSSQCPSCKEPYSSSQKNVAAASLITKLYVLAAASEDSAKVIIKKRQDEEAGRRG